ncbi:hypothetical protein K432DRAFT_425777 [Lepidopterella palustris CBS 459.81]|uniref:Utp8 beta-propeller domain-containing protein n=1 Tax=Lepidopterella palustris CBS 459.81 TaxID=1314670 RepID=A0A8E2EB70_9PEZI|nr:hypothetical protein K432DRAFT_425777 [Lepidopterella palustris CBS 459.81]
MSPSREIEAPHTLASLPRPVDSASGRTLASCVQSLSGSKRRKRTEIAVGVDGEGISIYNVKTPQLVTSYALPLHTYFTAPPCSVYRKGSKNQSWTRFTYASVTESSVGAKPQVLGFSEKTQKDTTQTPTKYSFNVPQTSSRIISVDIVPLFGKGEVQESLHDVIALHENGEIECLSADLKTIRWKANFLDMASAGMGRHDESNVSIEHISFMNAKSARQGLLKGRDDVLASLVPSMEEKPDAMEAMPILCVVANSLGPSKLGNGCRSLQLFSILPGSSDIFTGHRPHMQHLLTSTLPQPQSDTSSSTLKPTYSLNSTSGTLHQLINSLIITYDLSGTVPRISSELEITQTALQSFVRVSSNLLFAISASSCGLFDVKYNSIQAMFCLNLDQELLTDSKKRKHQFSNPDMGSSAKQFDLLTYFSDIGLVVGLTDHELIGIQIGAALSTSRKGPARDTLLIDSIGKGIRSKRMKLEQRDFSYLPKPLIQSISGFVTEMDPKWQEQVNRLDEFATNDDIYHFEAVFASEVGVTTKDKKLEAQKPTVTSRNTALPKVNGVHAGKLTNGAMEECEHFQNGEEDVDAQCSTIDLPLPEWQLPASIPDSLRHTYRHKAVYALGKIFTWNWSQSGTESAAGTDSRECSISIKLFPPNVFQWLILTGHLTKDLIERALHESSSNESDRTRSVSDGDIITAVVNYDPDMRLLYAILNQPSFFPIIEVVQAVKLLIQSLDNSPNPEPNPPTLTNNASSPDKEHEIYIQSEMEAASHDLDHALSILDDGLIIRSHTLRPALTRLHSFPASSITSTLRKSLTHHEIVFLIHLLRFELNDSGWVSRYFFNPDRSTPDDNSGDPSDHAIVIIASLLSCALDAVGVGGWLSTASCSNPDDSAEDVLHSLRLETSAALEGIWEAGFMRGLVSDFLRYSWKSGKEQQIPNQAKLRRQGKPLTVQERQAENAEQRLQETMLPLGLSEQSGIEYTKVGLGGKIIKRSAREVGMLISKRVPKYSFERIVI